MTNLKSSLQLGPASTALHADRVLESGNGVAPAIHQSVTHTADGADDFARKATEPSNDSFYARHGNPTSSRIARVIADLEGAESAQMFSSGMGAITTTVLALVRSGDHVIAQKNHYSATASFLSRFLPRFGVEVSLVEQQSTTTFAAQVRPNTKIILVETPVNPSMAITDLRAISDLAVAQRITTICDNTFATPINQKPIDLGIDVVVHSVTKYIGGHHDLLAGCVASSDNLMKRVWDTSMDLGPIAAPFNSWLALRGIRTLKIRMKQHNANAIALANFLEEDPRVARVFYPGLVSHPQHELAARQMQGFGGIVTFVLDSGYEETRRFVENLELCQNAASLGGVDTLVVQPAVMFRGRLSIDEIEKQGVTPGMIRMSVGIEDIEDLIYDIDQAMNLN